jgi:putative ABC transport system substrate-binding protein
MNRRESLLTVLVLAIAPLRAFSQVGKTWRIGFLGFGSGPNEFIAAFREQLRSLGYIEGRNLSIDYRWPDGKVERLPEMAAELVQLKVDIIVTQGTQPVTAAKRATGTIPIVMTAPSDAVGSGLVASLAHPGGNVTGMTYLSNELAGKRLQLLREVVPKVTRVAVLVLKNSPTTPPFLEQFRMAAQNFGITLVVREENEADALAGAFEAIQRERAQAIFVQQTPFTNDNRRRIVELVAQNRLPSMFESLGYVDEGGLLSYGPSLLEMFRRAAYYVDRIFKGAKPADLPVEQPSKFEMIVNLKTAKALGLKIPQSVLLRADRVIE